MQAYTPITGIEPRIEIIPAKKLVGKRMTMSLVNNKTLELWQSFMPRRKEIINPVSADLFSVQVYSASKDFKYFSAEEEFEKWAAQEVTDFDNVPAGMETITLAGGLYAVFPYKGNPAMGAKMFQYIFGYWIPMSEYEVDSREHFEILGEKYKNNDPESEEDIWVPIRKKV
ncbi:GyrI-like domain-containing protein [Ohtaekwangia sp.]|uniref:GyrI-like domain-containing protein n=1 Tax=Ohtaekwangia sp. TaxID=2066019 RepID=UPI002F952472